MLLTISLAKLVLLDSVDKVLVGGRGCYLLTLRKPGRLLSYVVVVYLYLVDDGVIVQLRPEVDKAGAVLVGVEVHSTLQG